MAQTNPIASTHMKNPEFDPIKDKIDGLAHLIREYADISDSQRHLSNEVAMAMANEGLYRIAAPRSVGGGEYHPTTQIQTIEAVSRLDGATGWNLMIGVEVMGILGAVFPREVVQKLFADPDLIIAGALNPLGHAVRTDGGFRVTGQWPFASGVHNASYFWGQSIVFENDDRVTDEMGPVTCESLIARDEFDIIDTWQVSGLRGSGSHDVSVSDVFVPDERISSVARNPLQEDGTLYRLPLHSRLAYNKVGVATGITRAAIDHFMDLAMDKTPRGTAGKLRERVDAQLAVAEAEYLLETARSYVFDRVSDIWDTVDQGDPPTTRQKALLQLACSGAASTAVKAVEKIVAAAGATANFTSSPLERCMRDVLVVRQHIMVSPQFKENIGRALLGLESGTFLF
jgi:alkylation response protein AidB-like acyl-CoA dehydrogenase|tara:strand:- start:152 stop:1351 length:1200 start_codon:yes stop_codon:yes gene_type:complete